MKVRVGFGPGIGGAGTPDAAGFFAMVDACEALGWDSIWFSERVTAPVLDPLACMAATAARTRRLKFGPSVLVAPGRDPLLLAKELATIDLLSQGRLVVALGAGAPGTPHALPPADAAALTEEAAGLIKRLWTEERVTHRGRFFTLDDVRLGTRPHRTPDVWFGGLSSSALAMTGRTGDGWLPSFVTPDEYGPKADAIRAHARDAGREIDEEHFGALVAYVPAEPAADPERALALVAARRPRLAPGELVPSGHAELRKTLERFIEHGASKLLIVPAVPPRDLVAELATARAEVAAPLED